MLDRLIERMPARTQGILKDQVKEITLVQRHQSRRVVQFYRIRNGLVREEFSIRLPGSLREQLLGKMLFEAHSGIRLTAEIWAANGWLFSIEFSAPPRSDLNYPDVDILEFERFPRRSGPQAELLPFDYESLASSNKVVLNLDEIYDIEIGSTRYWVLAEVPDLGLLGVEQLSSDRTLNLLPYSGDGPTEFGTSLAEALIAASKLAAGS